MNTFEILHIDCVLSKLNNYSRSSSIPEHPEVMMGALNPSFDSEDDFWDLSGSDNNNYVNYTYNQDGLRTRKTVCEDGVSHVTDYIWNDGVLIAERTEDQTITILYGEDGAAEGFVVEYDWYGEPEFQQYAYLKNLQGDVTHIISVDDDTVITSYVYDPWGNPTVFGDEEIAAINPCSYRGYYFDEETGWYYLQSRYYNPETGRFLNADEYIGVGNIVSNNIYTYCLNSPIMLLDINGHYAATISIPTFVSLFGAGLTGATLTAKLTAYAISLFPYIVGGIAVIVAIALTAYIAYVAYLHSTKTLSDTKARTPNENEKIFQLANVNSKGELKKFDKAMTFKEAAAFLLLSKNINNLTKKYGSYWGIYTNKQTYAKALAVAFGCKKKPEVHGDGFYAHYHDSRHQFHIWYGGKFDINVYRINRHSGINAVRS